MPVFTVFTVILSTPLISPPSLPPSPPPFPPSLPSFVTFPPFLALFYLSLLATVTNPTQRQSSQPSPKHQHNAKKRTAKSYNHTTHPYNPPLSFRYTAFVLPRSPPGRRHNHLHPTITHHYRLFHSSRTLPSRPSRPSYSSSSSTSLSSLCCVVSLYSVFRVSLVCGFFCRCCDFLVW